MLKKDARFHYGIKKHVCGTAYRDDYWVTGDDYRPLTFIYKQSADFICNEYQKKDKHSKYYVARLD